MNHNCIQKSFAEDATLSKQLFDLLEIIFPGLGLTQLAEFAGKLGASWESASTPFMCFEDGCLISHVGVLEIPLWLMGKPVTVGGIHAVATHPEFRRRGYYRSCMTAALNYCESRYKTLLLTTSQPELYEPFRFSVVREHGFKIDCVSRNQCNGLRVLDLENSGDCRILHQLLWERQPVSQVLGVVHERALFYVNECSRPLYYAEDLDMVLVMAIENTQLQLFDIVWKQPCQLIDILNCIPQPIDEVVFYFSPDCLNVEAQAFPHLLDGDSYLMVRGPFAVEEQPFMLPHSARC